MVTQELVNRLLSLALKLGLVGQKVLGLYFGMDLNFGAFGCDGLLFVVYSQLLRAPSAIANRCVGVLNFPLQKLKGG